MVWVMAVTVTSFKRTYASTVSTVPLTPQQVTVNPHLHQRLLDTHRQVWLSLSGGHYSFFLGPGGHKVLFVPSESLFPSDLCKFWRFYGGVNGDIFQEGLCHTQVYSSQSPCPCGSPC